MSLRSLLTTLGRGRVRAEADTQAADAPALVALQEELTALGRATESLQADLDVLRQYAAQSRALSDAEAEAAHTMAALETALDLATVTQHVRTAVAAAIVHDAPVAHVFIEGLLPEASLAAARKAVPSAPFVQDAGRDRTAVEVPLRVSPACAVATWMFLNDVANDLLGPLLRDTFAAAVSDLSEAAGQKLSSSRVVRVPAGTSVLDNAPAEGWMTVIVSLGPMRPNMALVFRGGPHVRETLRASLELSAADTCYAWELTYVPAAPRQSVRRRHGDIHSWAP